MPESSKSFPTPSELVAWALFAALEEQAFESASDLHDEMQRLESMPEWRLHAELYLASEDFREEFQPPRPELLQRLTRK